MTSWLPLHSKSGGGFSNFNLFKPQKSDFCQMFWLFLSSKCLCWSVSAVALWLKHCSVCRWMRVAPVPVSRVSGSVCFCVVWIRSGWCWCESEPQPSPPVCSRSLPPACRPHRPRLAGPDRPDSTGHPAPAPSRSPHPSLRPPAPLCWSHPGASSARPPPR